METLISQNGVEVRVHEEQVKRLLALGYATAEMPKPAPKRRTTTRKKPAKGE